MARYAPGDPVLIPFRHAGGEVVSVRPDGTSYNVRIVTFNPYTRAVDDHVEAFGEAELAPAPKGKGVIVL